MKLTAWAVFGSLLLTLLLALVVAGVFGAVPVRAGELHSRGVAHGAAPARQGWVAPAPARRGHRSYLVEARMGWAVS
jgi:hypothetical protein